MLQHLKLLAKIDNSERKINPDFDFLSDIDILKSFNLSLSTQIDDLYDGTLVKSLLQNRENRPSRALWNECISLAKSVNSSNPPIFAAELFFDVLQKHQSEEEHLHAPDFEKQVVESKKYPQREATHPDDAPPNITGGLADTGGGSFLSADS